jgi:hypothetical protein
MPDNTMTAGDVWNVVMFLVVPLLIIYIGLVWWSCTRDRWKR